ncbi:LPXTG cell wall anchor domain-containing protein [Streptomyces sp. NPDC058700]|uniref:LPXTG cell wall anchor domain-containing protein n=1 Tax=Streptomyces sp. NPDC058700 TaxID=3346607 RepID=UPI00365AFCFC
MRPGPAKSSPAKPTQAPRPARAEPPHRRPAQEESDDGGDSGSSLHANGESGPLAQTGGSDPLVPLGIATAVLALGGGLVLAARRKRS